MKPRRIHVLGVCGSGKTFFSEKLSKLLKVKVYDLDDIFWIKKEARKDNIKRSEKERKKLLKEIIKKKKWIIEGCYSFWIENSIKRSDFVIWLDPPFYVLVYRIILKFLKGKFLGSKEGWKDFWALLKYAKNYHKKGQPVGYYEHKKLVEKHKKEFVILKNNKDIKKFLEKIKSPL